MSGLKLYTDLGNFRAFKVLIAAEYNSIEVELPDFDPKKDAKSAEFLKKSPLGRVPVLETPSGSIFESNAIARYVARIRRDTELYGVSFFESGQVDSWIDFSAHEIELVGDYHFVSTILITVSNSCLFLGCYTVVLSSSRIHSLQPCQCSKG